MNRRMPLPRRIGIVAFKPKPKILEASRRFQIWSSGHKLQVSLLGEVSPHRLFPAARPKVSIVSLPPKRLDMILTLGGDGTLISAARLTHPHGIPLLGINVGTLGFLADGSLEKLEEALDKMMDGSYDIMDRMMLDVSVRRKGKTIWKNIALNEAVVAKCGSVKLINLATWSDQEFISRFWVDGLIIATPTGSTAYSLSAGGPLVHPAMEAVVLTPICPHALTERPMVLEAERAIRIRVEEKRPPAQVTVDGKAQLKLAAGDLVTIRRSTKKIRLIRLRGLTYFDRLRGKFNWSLKEGNAPEWD